MPDEIRGKDSTFELNIENLTTTKILLQQLNYIN